MQIHVRRLAQRLQRISSGRDSYSNLVVKAGALLAKQICSLPNTEVDCSCPMPIVVELLQSTRCRRSRPSSESHIRLNITGALAAAGAAQDRIRASAIACRYQ